MICKAKGKLWGDPQDCIKAGDNQGMEMLLSCRGRREGLELQYVVEEEMSGFDDILDV